MPADRAVLAALEQILTADPDNAAVRLHLAALYLSGGEPTHALAHCRIQWHLDPRDGAAYALGAQAAEAVGDLDLAEGLREAAEHPPEPTTDVDEQPPPLPRRRLPIAPPSRGPSRPAAAVPVTPNDPIAGDGAQPGERPTVRLADVAGMADVKRRLDRSFLAPMRHPELGAAFRKTLRGGLLLWGPPGVGKTLLARAVAGEIGSGFIHVRLSDVLDMWMGNSEKNVAALFARARRLAPAVLFLDELDAIGAKRSRLASSSLRQVIAQFLEELDGVRGGNDDVFMLAATNQPWDVDTAFRRPGRYDRTVLVLPPDLAAREAIVTAALEDRPTWDCNPAVIAARTDTYSGADLVFVVSTAAELALEASADAGEVRPITQELLELALADIGPSTHDWLRTAADVASFSDDTRMYGPLLDYLRRSGLR